MKINNIVVHTPRLEDYIEIVGYFLKCGCKWASGDCHILNDIWKDYESETCIHIMEDEITYSDIKYCVRHNEDIFNVKDFYFRIKCEKIFDEFI